MQGLAGGYIALHDRELLRLLETPKPSTRHAEFKAEEPSTLLPGNCSRSMANARDGFHRELASCCGKNVAWPEVSRLKEAFKRIPELRASSGERQGLRQAAI
jgi:hypothetical protein